MTGFLLDTNVVSELIRTRPEARVKSWIYARDEEALYLSVGSIGELRRGFAMLPPSQRRTQLERWFESDMLPRFQSRILPVTHSIADRWGVLDGQSQLNGMPLGTADGMLAAQRQRFRAAGRGSVRSLGRGVTLAITSSQPALR